ncbi:hypothetical protein ACVU7I_18200, partial [Patulibacter sp. S7RM1-6]
ADVVLVARRAPSGAWDATTEVGRRARRDGESGLRVRGTAIALGAGDRPTVLWSEGGTTADNIFAVRAASRTASGSWTTPADLGPESYGSGGGFDGSVVAHRLADGRVAAAWHDDTTVRAAVQGPDGTWGETATVAEDVAPGPVEVDLASDAESRPTVIWPRADDAAPAVSTLGSNGRWSAEQAVGTADAEDAAPSTPHLDADADGTLVATWAPRDGVLRAASRSANGSSWTLDDRDAPGPAATVAPDVAFDEHGNATVVWAEQPLDADGAPAGGAVVRTRAR